MARPTYTEALRGYDSASRARVLDSVAIRTRVWSEKFLDMGWEGAHTYTVLKIAAECLEWAAENERLHVIDPTSVTDLVTEA